MKTYLDYFYGLNPDVDVEEMKKSDSKAKYVHGHCWRLTIPLTLETTANEDEVLDKNKTKMHKQKAKRLCNILLCILCNTLLNYIIILCS